MAERLPTVAYAGLGANLGDRRQTLSRAVELLAASPGVHCVRVSTLRETEPVGYLDQPPFLNGAVELSTTLEPAELLGVLLDIERRLGRTREGPRFGPRHVDLDLLLCGCAVLDVPGLTLPHPRLHERRFVLEPLVELAPELVVPGRGRVADLLATLD